MKSKLFVLVFTIIMLVRSVCMGADISAKSAVVIDGFSGKIIYGKNPHQKLPMASTTKIMTAICALEEGDMDKVIAVDDRAVGVEGSSMYLTKGEKLTMRELVYGLMLNSGNDAAVAIACAVSGNIEAFAELMNKKAKEIGAKDTSFKNPNGLDEEGHYTTAYDLALIGAYALKNEEFKKIVSTYQTTVSGPEGKRYLTNHNKLLKRMEGCIGVKTGFTKKSGRCLVSACERDGVSVVGVTLNAPDDWNDHMVMTDYAMQRLKLKNVLKKGEYMGTLKVKQGTKKKLDALCQASLDIPMVEGVKYVTVVKLPACVKAPVTKGDKIASAKVYADGILVASADIEASKSIDAVEIRRFSGTFGFIATYFLGK